ncbi:hypothetical protein EL22_26635 [Halostagnicola sp. A56]|nr:hypothetical protein EL22_26635 [Halostagnicola sp. A56]
MSESERAAFFSVDFLEEGDPEGGTRREKRYACERQVSRGSAIADELEQVIDQKDPITVVPS